MKKQNENLPIRSELIEKDLKLLFQTDETACPQIWSEGFHVPAVTEEQARSLFDELGLASQAIRYSEDTRWTHPSVVALNEADPIAAIVQKARRFVIEAIEKGWAGPPYNPFTLAEMRGIKLLPTEEILDARTRSGSQGQFTIEFNPNRPPARIRYSIAHELGHTLFPDCAASIRNRFTHEELKGHDWQLESLCNIAAAELLMPFGTLQDEIAIRPSVDRVLELRHKYLVSCEAVVNRLVRLTSYPCIAFFARPKQNAPRYFVEYQVSSPGIEGDVGLRKKARLHPGFLLPSSARASRCTAIGVKEREDARWIGGADPWFVEYLGVSPNPGEVSPRVLGLAFPPTQSDSNVHECLRFIKGDATEPFGAGKKLLLQVVNDQAQVWGGGFAKQARRKWAHAQSDFRQWSFGRSNLRLGNVHSVRLEDDLTLVSLVAQHGFGKLSSGPRIRYGALFTALEKVAKLAMSVGASVHMPRIGAGEAGGSWSIIEGIIRDTLISSGVRVTVYDLPSRRNEFERQPALDFSAQIVDEVM
jgi:Zn-dependent peptidase ImmA (M78 family)/O-acetyl-ADP-ribose deacetylase (regulator of RNase III)